MRYNGFMSTIKTLSLMILLSACGPKFKISGFESYVSSFEQEAARHNHPLSVESLVIEFGQPADAKAYAVCQHGSGPFAVPHITVNQVRFEKASESQRHWVMFHEMGHCVLERTHVIERNIEHNTPLSVMDPHTMAGDLDADPEYFTDELFNPGKYSLATE